MAAPSANRFGKVSPTRAEHVVADLGDAVDLVVDGGPCRVGVESTIVEVLDDEPKILRLGAIAAEQVSLVVGRPVRAETSGPSRAPGMLPAHYAPVARVVIASSSLASDVVAFQQQGQKVAVLAEAPPSGLPSGVVVLDPVVDADGYARQLYERLREADKHGVDVVIAVPPPSAGAGAAVRDRLQRAANTHS